MDRINKIIKHELYSRYIDKIKEYEKSRVFCKHDTVHFMDVCRLAEIDWLNWKIKKFEGSEDAQYLMDKKSVDFSQINREMLYACGLLHDIGRWQEYETGIPHETASAKIAPEILYDCGFGNEEIEQVIAAIENHRNKDVAGDISLSGFLYRADKKSRPCYLCEMEHECNWSISKKNLEIK